MKQTFGFAVIGGLLALLGAALVGGLGAFSGLPRTVFDASFVANPSATGGYIGVALVGVVVGGLLGMVLWLNGFRMVGLAENRVARVVAAGLIGTAIGVGGGVVAAFGGFLDSVPEPAVILAIYAGCGIVAYILALAAVGGALRLSNDRAVRATVVAAAIALVPGALVATAVGIGTAWMLDFRTEDATWIAVIIVVVLVVAATLATARTAALRRVEKDSP